MKYSLFILIFIYLLNSICCEISVSPELQLQSEPRTPANSNVYKSYNRVIKCHPSEATQYPKSIQEVQNLVKYAITNDLKVKPIGSKHSSTDILCTDGLPIVMHGINHMNWNPKDNTASVGAGAELSDFLEFLNSKGRALTGMPTPGMITIGGAIAVGAHGSSLTHLSLLSDHIISLTVIDGFGSLRLINDPEELRGFRVNLGLLGIVVEVTFNTLPQYKVKVINYEVSESVLYDETVLEMARKHDTFSFWWLPNEQSVVIGEGTFVNMSVRGNAANNLLPNLTRKEIAFFRSIIEGLQELRKRPGLTFFESLSQRSLHQYVFGMPLLYTEGGNGRKVVSPAVGLSNRMLVSKCFNLPDQETCAWNLDESSSVNPEGTGFAMDVKHIPDIIDDVKHILKLAPAEFPLSSIWFRFAKASDSFMAIENGRDTVHVNIMNARRVDQYNSPKMGLAAFQAIFQSLVDKFSARTHWAESGMFYHNSDLLNKNFPDKPLFIQAMHKYDPNGIFLNDFGRRVLGISDKFTVAPQVTHCALQDYCICEKNSDCANFQICSKLRGYRVCKDRGASVWFANLEPVITNLTLSFVPRSFKVNTGSE